MKSNIFLKTLSQIAEISKSFEIDFDDQGNLRTLTSVRKEGLFTEQLRAKMHTLSTLDSGIESANLISKSNALSLAKQLLDLSLVKKALQLENCQLQASLLTPFNFGYRVSFRQTAYWQKGKTLAVRGGGVNIAMDKEGKIFSLSSTLQYGCSSLKPKSIIEKTEAIKTAMANCKRKVTYARAELMLSLHNGQLVPIYEINLVCRSPRANYTYIVLAATGEILGKRNRLLSAISEKAGIKAKTLLQTPDPDKPISGQISKAIIKNLPDPQILKNAYFEMLIGPGAKPVRIRADGTYCYGVRDPEFAAVSVFFSLMSQIELYLELGLWHPVRPLPIVVDDWSLPNNAYFDPLHYEIHLGVGTGVKRGGLNKHIAYDLGVANHEFGHAAVFLQSTGGDLPGSQGEAINEAMGDVLGTLVMDYWGRIKYDQRKKKFTADDLRTDSRIIGKYALPPFGIRSQKTNKCFPKDMTKEPHADGLIIGGALSDLLVDMGNESDTDLENQIRLFTQMNLMALALLPGYKVSFADMLRALITADQHICAGKYRNMIASRFADRGILFGAKLS